MSMRAREMLIDITLIFRYMDIIMVSRHARACGVATGGGPGDRARARPGTHDTPHGQVAHSPSHSCQLGDLLEIEKYWTYTPHGHRCNSATGTLYRNSATRAAAYRNFGHRVPSHGRVSVLKVRRAVFGALVKSCAEL